MSKKNNYPVQYQGYPSYRAPGCSQLSTYEADSIEQKTHEMNLLNNHVAASKTLEKNQYENYVEAVLAGTMNARQSQGIIPLQNAPSRISYFDWSVIPEELATTARDIAAALGWDPFAVLLALLGSFSIAMHGRYVVQLDPYWREPVVLYILIAKASGQRKSSLVTMLKSPMMRLMQELQDEYDQEKANRIGPMNIARMMKNVHLNAIAKREIKECVGADDYRQAVEAVIKESQAIQKITADYGTENSIRPELFVDSFTPKKIIRTMAAQGGGMAVFEPEGGFFKKLTNDKDINLLLKAYDMDAYAYEAVNVGRVNIPAPFLNLLYIVQPDIVSSLFSKPHLVDLGLLPRFMPYFTCPPPCGDPYFGTQGLSIEGIEAKLRSMLMANFSQRHTSKRTTLTVTEQAYAVVKDFEARLREDIKMYPQNRLVPFMRKLHGTACRIAAVFHAFKHDQPGCHPIQHTDMLAGQQIALVVLSHAAYAVAPDGLCAYKIAYKILEWVKDHKHVRFNSRDVSRDFGQVRNVDVFPALDLLERHNYLVQHINPKRSRECLMNPNSFYVN